MAGNPTHPGYRVGLVGVGGIARAHGIACQNLEEVELVAICDVSDQALRQYGDAFGVGRRYRHLDEMLASESLDIVIVCTWGVSHARTSMQIASSGRVQAILCEKPLASTAAEAIQMADVAKTNGVLLAEAFKFRHHPLHLKTKELIVGGAIGEVRTIRSVFYSNRPISSRKPDYNWRYNRAKGGGSVNDLGCYAIHHARWIFDREPIKIFATAQPGQEVDDGCAILLDFPGGGTAQIGVGFNSWATQYTEISGNEGMIRLDKVWNNEHQSVKLERQTPAGAETIAFPPIHQFTLQLRHLCACLTDGRPHRISPENSMKQMVVMDAVHEAIKTGQVVGL